MVPRSIVQGRGKGGLNVTSTIWGLEERQMLENSSEAISELQLQGLRPYGSRIF